MADSEVEVARKQNPAAVRLFATYSTTRLLCARLRKKARKTLRGYRYMEGTARGRSNVSELTSCRNRGTAGRG